MTARTGAEAAVAVVDANQVSSRRRRRGSTDEIGEWGVLIPTGGFRRATITLETPTGAPVEDAVQLRPKGAFPVSVPVERDDDGQTVARPYLLGIGVDAWEIQIDRGQYGLSWESMGDDALGVLEDEKTVVIDTQSPHRSISVGSGATMRGD